jgi:PAS domain S-box-containing protein
MLTKILHLEDLSTDAELIERVLKKANLRYQIKLVDNKADFEAALDEYKPDIILSDHSLPGFDSLGALDILQERDLHIPFILITSAMSEEFAVQIMKRGANDYILKDRLNRLPNAISSALEKRRMEVEHQSFLDKLIVNESLLKETEYLANIGSFKADLVSGTMQWSEQLYRILDYEPAEVAPSEEMYFKKVHRDDVERIKLKVDESLSNLTPLSLDYRLVGKRGTIKFIHSELQVKANKQKQPVLVTGFIQDVTAQKKAEDKILKTHRLYAFISQINQALIHIEDEQTLFRTVCGISLIIGKFKAAWAGLIDTENKSISMIGECGLLPEDIEKLTYFSYENNRPKEYVAKIGSYYVCNDVEKDPEMSGAKSFASQRGFGSCIMLPIRKQDELYGIFNLYAAETNFFDFEEIKLLEEVVGDISFALDNFEKEKQRQMAEEKLAKNEAVLKEAQAIAHVGNWSLNLSTNVALWSEEACRIYGMPSYNNEHSYQSWLSFVHPDDLDNVRKIMESPDTVGKASFHHRIIRKDGAIRYVHSQARFQLDANGSPVGITGVVHDVTEEKKTELLLRDKELYLRGILDSTDNGILAVDKHGKIINFNHHFVEIWKIPDGFMEKGDDALLQNHVQDMLVNPEEFSQKVKEIYESDETSIDIIELKDGRGLERYSTPLILLNEFVGRVWSFRDISERRKHVQAIEMQNERLREIAWIQSHVVRAPLSRLLGIADQIKKQPGVDVSQVQLIDYLIRSANELDEIIRAIVEKTEAVKSLQRTDPIKLS